MKAAGTSCVLVPALPIPPDLEEVFCMKKMINLVCVGLAFLCLGVGCIGILLPILPTTPFLLVSLCLFAKGSERFHRWFMSTGIYKTYLEDFVVTRSMKRSVKIRVLTVVTLLLAFGFWFSPGYAKAVIAVVWVFHLVYFLFGIRTADEKENP